MKEQRLNEVFRWSTQFVTMKITNKMHYVD